MFCSAIAPSLIPAKMIGFSATSLSASSPAKPSPSSATPAPAKPRSSLSFFASMTFSGQILLDGIDIRKINLQDLRRLFGIVLQDPFLFTGTIESNVRLGTPNIDRDTVENAICEIGLADFIESLPEGVAASVNTKTELQIRDALDRLLSGRTALVIAHRLSTIQHADRILVFHKGRLREEGAHQELLALRGIYYRLYQLQYKEQELHDTNGVAGATVLPAPTPASD